MAHLKQMNERMLEEIAYEFKDQIDEGILKYMFAEDMGFETMREKKREDNYYYSFLADNSSKYPNGVAGATRAYAALSEEEKRTLKADFQARESERSSSVQRSKVHPMKSLQKLANKLYVENDLHVVAYATVRRPLANIVGIEDYAVYGTSCAVGFDKMVCDTLAGEKCVSNMFREYVLMNDSGQTPSQAIVRDGRFRIRTVPRTEAQKLQARRRTLFNSKILSLMNSASNDQLKKNIPWSDLSNRGRSGDLVLMGWPAHIELKSKISMSDMEKIEGLIDDKTIFFSRPENPNLN